MTKPCPTSEWLAAALRSRLPGGADADLAAHLADCAACQAKLESQAGGSGWLAAKAKTHVARVLSEPLRRAVSALESRPGDAPADASTPHKLDFLQPPDQPGLLGKFGPYEVLERVASGGMGIVLKARDPALNRMVALKVLPPAQAANSLARARFVREARAAAAVVHEHVVPIYAVDECAGLPYLVMQFVQGRTLLERIRATGPLRLEEILRIGVQTASGLAAAHAQGLIHRDVKPGNILLENSVERVKLTDFGLARAVDDTGLTRTGELAGTPEFMAPEQANNEALDHRADLFSFGSVLYAMCTGCSPFQATSVIGVVRKVCDEQPPPAHEVNPAIPRWLSDIVARLMAKSPAERFQSAREVGELLERYLARVQHGELSELPEGGARDHFAMRGDRRTLAYAAIVTLAVVAALVFVLQKRSAPKSAPRPQPGSPFVALTASGKSVGGFANFTDVLAAVPPGGVIELCWNGPRDIDPVRLAPKPLTLRAGRGFQPVWTSPGESAPALSASAALILEGIHFVMIPRAGPAGSSGRHQFQPDVPREPPSGLALVSITNGFLRVTRCAFDARALNAPKRACIVLANVTACRVENTLLFAPPAKAIVWQQNAGGNVDSAGNAAQLLMTNCIAVAGEVFWLDLHEASRARIEITRCTFCGPDAFHVSSSLAAANLEVNARQNVFDTGRVFFDARNPASPPLQQWLRWREQENLYCPERRSEDRYIVGVAIEDGPTRLEDWHRWWNQAGVNSRQVQIKYADSKNNQSGGRLRRVSFEPRGFQITELVRVAGPSLPREEWSRFGADTESVGLAPLK